MPHIPDIEWLAIEARLEGQENALAALMQLTKMLINKDHRVDPIFWEQEVVLRRALLADPKQTDDLKMISAQQLGVLQSATGIP